MPFNEYIDDIKKIYNVEITSNDLLRISSFILNGHTKCTILNTNIIFVTTRKIEVNGKFEYPEKEHNLYLKIVYTDDNITDFDYRYNIDEINKLINEKKIILLEFVLENENDLSHDDEYEGLSPLSIITKNDFTKIKYIRNDYIPGTFMFFKSYFNADRLKSDLTEYISDVKQKLVVLENYINNSRTGHTLKLKKFDDITCEISKIRERKISKD